MDPIGRWRKRSVFDELGIRTPRGRCHSSWPFLARGSEIHAWKGAEVMAARVAGYGVSKTTPAPPGALMGEENRKHTERSLAGCPGNTRTKAGPNLGRSFFASAAKAAAFRPLLRRG